MKQKTKMLLKLFLMFMVKRLGEAPTWASLAAMLAGAHIMVNPGLWQHIVDAAMALAGMLGFILTEGDSNEDQK